MTGTLVFSLPLEPIIARGLMRQVLLRRPALFQQ